MTKYLIIYNAALNARDLMANSSPEEMQASMAEWLAWRDVASETATVDFGMPLQAVARVTPDGVTNSNNPASGYSMLEGEPKADIMALLQTHPHLKTEGASIDVFELLPMPGL
ncbi:MAG: hypothetical protein ABI602_02775 [Candidatus Saccharibacteria bacterium]